MADSVPPTSRNTKRYARLVDGNLRNFRRQVSIVVRALCVGCYMHLPAKVILTTSIKRRGIAVPRFFCMICPLWC